MRGEAALAEKKGGLARSWWLLLFLLCTSLLMGSGRLGSADAGDQVSAAFHAVHYKRFGATVPPGGMQTITMDGKEVQVPARFWWQAPNGLYYQTHDIGNVALFLPIAFATSLVSKAPAQEQFESPPLIGKLLVSLLFCVIGALTAFLVYKTLGLFISERAAFWFGVAFLPITFMWPFCKTVWDVTPAALFATLQLYFCARILTSANQVRTIDVIGAALATSVCGLFRYSFVAFLVVGLSLTLLAVRSRLRPVHFVLAGMTLVAGLIPAFASNQVRMGKFWVPATTIPTYIGAVTPHFGKNVFEGLFGLTFSPNKGLFIYCPPLLLLLGLPWLWSRLQQSEKLLILTALTVATLYTCAIEVIPMWSGHMGWGPRYLVPIVAFLYIPFAILATTLLNTTRHKQAVKASLVAVLALTALGNVPPALVNWPLVLAENPKSREQTAWGFYPQEAMWRELVRGAQGRPVEVRTTTVASDYRTAENAQFPDLWLARLLNKGGKTALAGMFITLLLLGGAALSLYQCFRYQRAVALNSVTAPPN